MASCDSPCIGICSTTYGDHVCRGCKRHYDEVISWNAFKNEEKQDVLERINDYTSHIVKDFLEVISAEKLEQALQTWNVRYRKEDNPLTWALQLLKFADHKVTSISDVGIKIHDEYTPLSLHLLCNTIDKALYVYACENC